MELRPRISAKVQEFIKRRDLLFQVSALHKGPVHVLFPQMMGANIKDLQDSCVVGRIVPVIHYAHKANKSIACVRQAQKAGVNIDVASENELGSALRAGFVGERILCTGPKSDEFLRIAILQRCRISCDSVGELGRIRSQAKILGMSRIRVLLRVSDPMAQGRDVLRNVSRFGISRKEVKGVLERFIGQQDIILDGFHFHNYEKDESRKQAYIKDVVDLMSYACSKGLSPTVIDIGGSFRRPQADDPAQWSAYVNDIERRVKEGKSLDTWGAYAFGLKLQDGGRLIGHEALQDRVVTRDDKEALRRLLYADAGKRSLAAEISENGWAVFIEPGSYLLDQCGITVIRVIDVKTNERGENMVVLEGNLTSLSTRMFEQVLDPMLVPKNMSNSAGFDCFLVGNLCREDDIICKRMIQLSQYPRPGDLLCFVNTAAYVSDFEDAAPAMQPGGKKFVAYQSQSEHDWVLCDEEQYDPYGVDDR